MLVSTTEESASELKQNNQPTNQPIQPKSVLTNLLRCVEDG